MKKVATFLFIFLCVGVLVGAVLLAAFFWDAFFITPSPKAQEMIITVDSGATVKEISYDLKELGLIPSRWEFELYVKMIHAETSFQAGEFSFEPGTSYAKIVSLMTKASPDELTITIPEGFTNQQIAELLNQRISPEVGTKWLADLSKQDFSKDFSFLSSKPVEVDLEGYLFPDTYRIFSSSFTKDLIYKFLTNFDKKLLPEWRVEIERQGKTVHEVLTVASIIEKEVITEEDRAIVSDIFWRRLKIGMPLQADSTVNYVTGGSSPAISFIDREIDSPYNTYKNVGLPPGPICNPGLLAIKAAIFPQANDYWYFLTDSESNVHYARTNDEQNVNKALYLK